MTRWHTCFPPVHTLLPCNMSRAWFQQPHSPMLTKIIFTWHTTLLDPTPCLVLALVGSATVHLPSFTPFRIQVAIRPMTLRTSEPPRVLVLTLAMQPLHNRLFIAPCYTQLVRSPIAATQTLKERQRRTRRTNLPSSKLLCAMALAASRPLSRSHPLSFRTEVIIRPVF